MPTELVLVLLDREGTVRFTLSGYYAHWQNPFRVSTQPFYNLITNSYVPGRTVRVFAQTPASPLIEGKYLLNRRWSLGFWYNPIRGERLVHDVLVQGQSFHADLSRDTDLADVHVIYAAARGMTVQLGYYHEHGVVSNHLVTAPLGTSVVSSNYTLVSWNFWLAQRLDVFFRNRLTSERLDAQLIPFVSFGYDAASSLRYAKNILAGVAVTFSEKISLSSTIWLFDLRNTATRITAGLVIQY